jgi:hypothetical protein
MKNNIHKIKRNKPDSGEKHMVTIAAISSKPPINPSISLVISKVYHSLIKKQKRGGYA